MNIVHEYSRRDSGVENGDQQEPIADINRHQAGPNPNEASERANLFDSAIDLNYEPVVIQSYSSHLFGARVERSWFTRYRAGLRVALLYIPLIVSFCLLEYPKWFTLFIFRLPWTPFLFVALYGTGLLLLIIVISLVRCAFSNSYYKAFLYAGPLNFLFAVPVVLICVYSFHMLHTILASTCSASLDNSSSNTTSTIAMPIALDFFPDLSVFTNHSKTSEAYHDSTVDPQLFQGTLKIEHHCCASIVCATVSLLELLLEALGAVYFLLESIATLRAHWRSRPRLSTFLARGPGETRGCCVRVCGRLVAFVGWALCLLAWPFTVRCYYVEKE